MEIIKKHFLYPAALFASKTDTVVTTILGTCVAVCLYDPVRRMGGINHFMLPNWDGSGMPSAKYGDVAIKQLLDRMLALGCVKGHLQAKVFGGLRRRGGADTFNIGERNIQLAQTSLSQLQLTISAQHTGGSSPRKLTFNTATGEVKMDLLLPEMLK